MKGYEAMIQAKLEEKRLKCRKCNYTCLWPSEMLQHNWEKHDKANNKKTKSN